MAESAAEGPIESGTPRGRIIAALLLTLGAAVGVALLLGGGGDQGGDAFAAPEECLDAWNGDEDALSKGRHASTFHVYDEVTVGHLADDSEVAAEGSGPCVVVFARTELDPEMEWAAFEADGDVWSSLSERLEPSALSALQTEALETANATIIPTGELAVLED